MPGWVCAPNYGPKVCSKWWFIIFAAVWERTMGTTSQELKICSPLCAQLPQIEQWLPRITFIWPTSVDLDCKTDGTYSVPVLGAATNCDEGAVQSIFQLQLIVMEHKYAIWKSQSRCTKERQMAVVENQYRTRNAAVQAKYAGRTLIIPK